MIGFVLAGIFTGYLVVRYQARTKFFAHAEYWVYLPGTQLPGQQEILKRLVGNNPYAKRGRSPIGTAEGQLLTDVRLHIGLVLRGKNPHVFRPDLFDSHTNVTSDHLALLADSHSFAKLRFVSEKPMIDRRHLQFLTHASDAIADLGGGKLIFDQVLAKVLTKPELETLLSEKTDQTTADRHVDVVWESDAFGGHAETRGMIKIGLPEIVSASIRLDERFLGTEVIREAAYVMWETGHVPEPWKVHSFEDDFEIVPEGQRNGKLTVRIMRLVPE